MRKNNIILAFAAVLLTLVSCVKENMPGEDSMVTFSAAYGEDPAVKTVLDGLTPFWTPSDRISVYDGENNLFENTGSSVSSKTSFKGNLAGKGRKYYLAAYPYDSELSFAFLSKSVYGFNMPTEQVAVENSYDPSAAKAIAYSEDFNLTFKNVCSLIKFKVISDGVKSVTIKANGGEAIAGVFNAAWGVSPTVTVTNGKNSITLKGDFKKDGVYYITTIPAVLKQGMEVVLNGEVVTFRETYQIALSRNGMVNLGDISLDASQSQIPDEPVIPDTPAEEELVYFRPTSAWKADGARFAAYFFEADMPEVWVDLTEDAVAGVFKCELPAGYSNIIFVRMNPAFAENSWDNKWEQTIDLSVPTDDKICFIPSGLDEEYKTIGSWTTYPPAGETPDPEIPDVEIETDGVAYLLPNSNWLGGTARFAAYFFETGKPEVWVDLYEDTVSGVFKCDLPAGYSNIIFVKMDSASTENNWDNKRIQTADLKVPVGDDVCFVINPGTWGGDGYWTSYPPVIPDDPNPGEGSQIIYLNAGGSSLWDQADSWFEAWSWADGSEGSWYRMTSVEEGLYQCTIPSANKNIIFVRRGPDMTTGWDQDVHYWNKTDDLVIPDGSNLYTITGWGETDGVWSTK